MQNLSSAIHKSSLSIYRAAQPIVGTLPRLGHFRRYSAEKAQLEKNGTIKCEEIDKQDNKWELNPECGEGECHDARRLDEICLPDSRAKKGPFQQTWAECPPRVIEEVPFCAGEKMPVDTPRKGKVRDIAKQVGPIDTNEHCMKIQLPGCKEPSKAVKCQRTRLPADCVPIPAPTLSFSECEKDLPPWRAPTECNCFEKECAPTDT